MNLSLIDHLTDLYDQNKNPSNAESVIRYLKNHFGSFGIKHPDRRILDKTAISKYGLPDLNTYKELFNKEEREFHHFAIETLFKDRKNWTVETLKLIEWMILNKSWWDTVDNLATNHCPYFFKKFPGYEEHLVNKWNKNSNMWLNRVSIIYQIKRKKEIDLDRLYRSIVPHTESKEFFIQKAIGWALRETSKYHADWVVALCSNTPLKPLSRREALRLLK